MGKKVTMKDIAKRLSVSTVTVSKALADKDGVSEELRETIKSLASEMGYSYTSPSEKEEVYKSYNVGIIVASNYFGEGIYPFYFKMYQRIVMSLSAQKHSGILELITPLMREKKMLPNIVADRKVDGIIVLGQLEKEYLKMIRERGIPLVYLDFYDNDMEESSVITDNVYGAYMLADYIAGMGHKKIAFVGNIYATSSILDRYLGYCRALLERRLEIRKDYLISDRGKDELFIELELPKEMPTAFVCNCDEIAYILIDKLNQKGYRVPEDVSVVGFDNYTTSRYPHMQLTTVEVNMEAMVENAVQLLAAHIDGFEEKGRRVIGGKLIIGDSVAKVEQN